MLQISWATRASSCIQCSCSHFRQVVRVFLLFILLFFAPLVGGRDVLQSSYELHREAKTSSGLLFVWSSFSCEVGYSPRGRSRTRGCRLHLVRSGCDPVRSEEFPSSCCKQTHWTAQRDAIRRCPLPGRDAAEAIRQPIYSAYHRPGQLLIKGSLVLATPGDPLSSIAPPRDAPSSPLGGTVAYRVKRDPTPVGSDPKDARHSVKQSSKYCPLHHQRLSLLPPVQRETVAGGRSRSSRSLP